EAIAIANRLAPEHLELAVRKPAHWMNHVHHAGAVFLGQDAPEAFGDYLAGPNHVLPTGGTARFGSPLGVYDFVKRTSEIETGVPFLNHMLEIFARHGFFDLSVRARGDVEVDDHHTVEDVGLCLGQGFREALGDKAGIRRFGEATVPLDEALVTTVVDLSGRPFFVYDVRIEQAKIGLFDVELIHDFLLAFTNQAALNLHVRMAS